MEKMTKLCITYHLEKDVCKKGTEFLKYSESAENCITTVFDEKIAGSLVRLQMQSPYAQIGCPGGIIHQWINTLAVIQGYDRGYFVMAEEVDI